MSQQPPGELFPVRHRRLAERNQALHLEAVTLKGATLAFLHIVARTHFAARVEIEAEVDAVLFKLREQIVELVERLRIEGQRIGRAGIEQAVFEVVKTNRVVAEPGRLGHEIVGQRLVEIIRGTDQVRAEEADPLFRRITK